MLIKAISYAALTLLVGRAASLPQGTASNGTRTTTGAAAVAAVSSEPTSLVDPSLPDHTIFRPADMSGYSSLPAIVWGNGACSADSNQHLNFLLEVAAWGNIVIVSGTPGASGSTTPEMMTQSVDWAQENAGQGDYANMNADKVAAAGMSCGGTEAYEQADDERVSAIGIFNSGQLSSEGTEAVVAQLTKPIFFFLGGPTDIAYENGMRDFAAVPSGVPTWVGNDDSGHGGTYSQEKGGRYATAAQHFFRWVLQGDTSAAEYFTGGGAQADGWTTDSRGLEGVSA